MTQIILIVALILAIILDIVRIVQYIAMRELTNKYDKHMLEHKIDSLHNRWMDTGNEYPNFGRYYVERMDEWKDGNIN